MRGLYSVLRAISFINYFILMLGMGALGYALSSDLVTYTKEEMHIPNEKALISAEGFFLKHNYEDCRYINCHTKGYSFQLSDGRVIELNCEPYPPINMCLDIDRFQKKYREVDGLAATVGYYNDYLQNQKKDYFVMLSVKTNEGYIINYNDRVEFILNTVTGAGEGSVNHRVTKSGFTWFHGIVYSICLMLFLAFIVKIFPVSSNYYNPKNRG